MPAAAAMGAPVVSGGRLAPAAAGGGANLPVLFGASAHPGGAPTSWSSSSDEAPDGTGAARPGGKRERKLQRPRWRRLAAVSATLAVGGALAANWSKTRADRAYDRYLHAAGPRRQEGALDRAERYDRLAGAGFLAMEAGLAACAYLVFF